MLSKEADHVPRAVCVGEAVHGKIVHGNISESWAIGPTYWRTEIHPACSELCGKLPEEGEADDCHVHLPSFPLRHFNAASMDRTGLITTLGDSIQRNLDLLATSVAIRQRSNPLRNNSMKIPARKQLRRLTAGLSGGCQKTAKPFSCSASRRHAPVQFTPRCSFRIPAVRAFRSISKI